MQKSCCAFCYANNVAGILGLILIPQTHFIARKINYKIACKQNTH